MPTATSEEHHLWDDSRDRWRHHREDRGREHATLIHRGPCFRRLGTGGLTLTSQSCRSTWHLNIAYQATPDQNSLCLRIHRRGHGIMPLKPSDGPGSNRASDRFHNSEAVISQERAVRLARPCSLL